MLSGIVIGVASTAPGYSLAASLGLVAAAEVKQPIRVYAGLRSAGSANERAALAVRELERPDACWRHPRVLYMHHPSDSVGNATLEPFWRRPEKTDRPYGYDIPARAGWYPVVTGPQEVFDLIAGFSAASGQGTITTSTS